LSRERRQDVAKNDEYAAFAHRILRAHSRRVGAGDIEALATMTALAGELERAIQERYSKALSAYSVDLQSGDGA